MSLTPPRESAAEMTLTRPQSGGGLVACGGSPAQQHSLRAETKARLLLSLHLWHSSTPSLRLGEGVAGLINHLRQFNRVSETLIRNSFINLFFPNLFF